MPDGKSETTISIIDDEIIGGGKTLDLSGNPKATILAAALRRSDGYLFILQRPNRHHHIIEHMTNIGHSPEVIASCEQGFITGGGVFLDRKSAWRVAEEAGQINRLSGGVEGLLFSENLW